MLFASAMFTYVTTHLGWRVDCVLSGSMEPVLHTGSLAITHPVKAEDIKVGDIITFHDSSENEIIISHRVVEIWDNQPIYFQTRGDANATNDPFKVSAQNLIGRISFHLPLAGYAILFLKTPAGFIVSIVVPTIILLVLYVQSMWIEIRKLRKQRAEKAVKQ